MAQSLNRVQLIGHLGKDPEIRTIPSGTSVCNFNIATTESYKDKISNEWVSNTEWHRIVAWEWMADYAAKNLKKGYKVYVEGKLVTRQYEQDGTTRYITEIRATNLIFMGEPKGEYSGPGETQMRDTSHSYSQSEPKYEQPDSSSEEDEDDVPF